MNNITEILVEARNLISDPERWTQGRYARDAQGNYTEWNSTSAVCWCAAGAIRKAVSEQIIQRRALVRRAIDEFEYAALGIAIYPFNDTHNHAEVMAAFDRAIEASGSNAQ